MGGPRSQPSHHSPQAAGTRSPQQAPVRTEPPILALPEFGEPVSPQLDLSFTASLDAESTQPGPQFDPQGSHNNVSRISEGSNSLGDAEGNPETEHGQTQKMMLSKALQKANTAVLLDNAANFEGAMEAYIDACQLLQRVMLQSNGGAEEKMKLQEIRDTYKIRIGELQRMVLPPPGIEDKALPQRPVSEESYRELLRRSARDGEAFNESQQSFGPSGSGLEETAPEGTRRLPSGMIPPKRQSSMPSNQHQHVSHSRPNNIPPVPNNVYHARHGEPSTAQETNDSTSWLDTIDESGASSPSSANSKGSSVYLRRRTSRRLTHDTEAEFDAALDAAVEAAYDEGLEPVLEYKEEESDDIVANARRNIELAKQRVREAEREAQVAMNRGRGMRQFQGQKGVVNAPGLDSDYLDDEAEEEERLLEEMTKGYVDDFEFGLQSKSALPRESDSSNMSGRTWESSAASNITSTGATLSTLAEDDSLPPSDQKPEPNPPAFAPPSSTLPVVPASSDFPALPEKRASLCQPSVPANSVPSPSVRARRLSGQNAEELKIETSASSRADSKVSGIEDFSTPLTSRPPPPVPKDQPPAEQSRPSTAASRLTKRNPSVGSLGDNVSTTSLPRSLAQEDYEAELPPLPSSARPIAKIPSAPDGLDKSSSGFKGYRARNTSVPTPDTAPDSPITPFTSTFPPLDAHKNAFGANALVPPTPTGTGFTSNGLPTSGLNLFNNDIHSPTALGYPNPMMPNAPHALEPCPESFLLRPFWLMRCLYQTIAHPHGGYLSGKLFIPRDVWRVKNVKLKAVEEKVSNCDLLTAALLKLAQVDTFDADAVLEEMQSLESVLDQAQSALSKKLGTEVGVHAAMPLFKPSSVPDEQNFVDALPSKASSTSHKSSFSSWKRLRAKTSGVGSTNTSLPSLRESNKDNLTLNSLPMSSTPTTHPNRNVTQLEYSGPNAHYMGALARLFDAAQVLGKFPADSDFVAC